MIEFHFEFLSCFICLSFVQLDMSQRLHSKVIKKIVNVDLGVGFQDKLKFSQKRFVCLSIELPLLPVLSSSLKVFFCVKMKSE